MTNEQTIEDRATQPLKRKAEFRNKKVYEKEMMMDFWI